MTSLDQLIFLILSILMTVFFVGLGLIGFKQKKDFMAGLGISMAIIFFSVAVILLIFMIGLEALLAIILSGGFVSLILCTILMLLKGE